MNNSFNDTNKVTMISNKVNNIASVNNVSDEYYNNIITQISYLQ